MVSTEAGSHRDVADPCVSGVFGEGWLCLLKPVPVSRLSLEILALDMAAPVMGQGAERRWPC